MKAINSPSTDTVKRGRRWRGHGRSRREAAMTKANGAQPIAKVTTKRAAEPIRRHHTADVSGYLRQRVKARAWSFESGCSREVYVDVTLDAEHIATVRVPLRLARRPKAATA